VVTNKEMKEIHEIIKYLESQIRLLKINNDDSYVEIDEAQKQLDNANKVKAKLQGAIDLFKEIEQL
jgi:hypothetical protein